VSSVSLVDVLLLVVEVSEEEPEFLSPLSVWEPLVILILTTN